MRESDKAVITDPFVLYHTLKYLNEGNVFVWPDRIEGGEASGESFKLVWDDPDIPDADE